MKESRSQNATWDTDNADLGKGLIAIDRLFHENQLNKRRFLVLDLKCDQ